MLRSETLSAAATPRGLNRCREDPRPAGVYAGAPWINFEKFPTPTKQSESSSQLTFDLFPEGEAEHSVASQHRRPPCAALSDDRVILTVAILFATALINRENALDFC
ncbi:uncharacterized protein LOC122261217 [Penaeus japonicus]|uniref:uncharacterized protein LOC122261217 n=1 Tax=Penaeus japonicus TaxID=27405 RepID=UPI001C714D0E|nr:uncharacterized protein LOC122261217 [Penaeus japonicus]